ncbi:hypothetical protein C7974DRAFT_75097 [Boeremia exigua]|uniref:uncharacterized protein n=1 Tax=Boeremia exigua TaxID=749465 RepID=UPI001E8D0A25|nr:uncharacterized protein C7974DRAFT_75097 [Boeremia exigua]KAH6613031.1 hypothetical protein C7974DRAFT_75097 [Boeremia exigua]
MSAQHFQPRLVTPPASPSASPPPSACPPVSPSASSPAAAPASSPVSSGSPSTSSASTTASPSRTDRNPSPLTGAARDIFEFVRDWSSGRTSRYSISARLTKAEHTLLEDKTFEDFSLGDLYSKSCSIWLPPSHVETKGWLVVSMPPRVHNEFCHLIRDELVNRIATFRQDPRHPACAASSKVVGKAKTDIEFSEDGRLRPDIVFEYEGPEIRYTTFPLVIKVGYSQTAKDLARRAKSALRNTDIRTMITFCLPYQYPTPKRKKEDPVNQEATYTIRRIEDDGHGDVHCTKVEGIFRNQHGLVQSGHLQLNLNDFLPDGYLLDSSNEIAISVSHETLAGFLASAFQQQAKSTVPRPKLSEKRLNIAGMSDDESEPVATASSNNSPAQDRMSDKDYLRLVGTAAPGQCYLAAKQQCVSQTMPTGNDTGDATADMAEQ